MPIYQRLWHLICYAQRLYWIDTLLWLGIIGLPIIPGILIQRFFDSLTQQSTLESPWLWIGLLVAAGIARVITIFLGRITKTQHRFLMSGLVRHNLLLGLLNRPGAELAVGRDSGKKTSPGELLSYFRDDALQIENTTVFTNEIFAEAIFALVAVGLLLRVSVSMTLLVFLPLCAIALLVQRAEHRLKRYRRTSRQATQQVTGLIGELFTSVQAVKVAGAEASMLHELQQRCDLRRQLIVREQVFNALLNASFETIVSLGTGLILLVAAQNLGDSLTVGDFALFVYYLTFITYFFAFLGSFFATVQQSDVSFERIAEQVEDQEPGKVGMEALTHPHNLYLKPILGAEPDLPSTAKAITPTTPLQQLRVTGLTYTYPNSNTGIQDISFTLNRGSLTVITGRVGSGKTTLLRVLLGLLPRQSGVMVWNGQQIHEPANFLVPPRAAYTPQIPQLFSASLRDNLLLGLVDGGQQLERAIATAAFDQDLAAMPAGLDTLIGTRGVRLSGGQKQRLAAARMLLRQAELFIFDDLSSALDVETEQQLWEGLLSPSYPLPLSSTYLTVSHRPAILQQANQVILLEAGQIVFFGSSQDFFVHQSGHC
ncbi:MAG: ABC transporter ATP-binding protein [Cyanobacteria bacterium P01_D01_bin.56]